MKRLRPPPPSAASALLRMAALAFRAHDWRVAGIEHPGDPGRRRWLWRCCRCGDERKTFPGRRPDVHPCPAPLTTGSERA